jgi:hypothetical protein
MHKSEGVAMFALPRLVVGSGKVKVFKAARKGWNVELAKGGNGDVVTFLYSPARTNGHYITVPVYVLPKDAVLPSGAKLAGGFEKDGKEYIVAVEFPA